MNIIKHSKEALEELLEEIYQHSEGSCPFCGAKDCPVNGDKIGYGEVLPEDAQEWKTEHFEDCFVLNLENALKTIDKEMR